MFQWNLLPPFHDQSLKERQSYSGMGKIFALFIIQSLAYGKQMKQGYSCRALHTGHILPARKIPGTLVYQRLSGYQGYGMTGGIKSIEKSSDHIPNGELIYLIIAFCFSCLQMYLRVQCSKFYLIIAFCFFCVYRCMWEFTVQVVLEPFFPPNQKYELKLKKCSSFFLFFCSLLQCCHYPLIITVSDVQTAMCDLTSVTCLALDTARWNLRLLNTGEKVQDFVGNM